MAVPEHRRISADAFLDWIKRQKDRFELIDGHVVRMMTGARQSHTVVTSNILVALAPQAKPGGFRTTASDTAVRTSPDGVRYPDVVVDCGPRDPSAREAVRPILVVEVSSPGTSAIDATDKLDEYRGHGDIVLIVFVDPDLVSVKVYRRDRQGAWAIEKFDALDHVVDFPEIGARLALAEIYDTLDPKLRPRLHLVEDETVRDEAEES